MLRHISDIRLSEVKRATRKEASKGTSESSSANLSDLAHSFRDISGRHLTKTTEHLESYRQLHKNQNMVFSSWHSTVSISGSVRFLFERNQWNGLAMFRTFAILESEPAQIKLERVVIRSSAIILVFPVSAAHLRWRYWQINIFYACYTLFIRTRNSHNKKRVR